MNPQDVTGYGLAVTGRTDGRAPLDCNAKRCAGRADRACEGGRCQLAPRLPSEKVVAS